MCYVYILLLVGLISCAKEEYSEDFNEMLQLELIMSDCVYEANTPIDCKAVLSYTGDEDFFHFYSGDPVIMFAIGGPGYFNGESDLLNKGAYLYTINKDNPIECNFKKYIGNHLNTDEAAVDFWKRFVEEDDLLLDVGDYEIFAKCSYSLSPGEETITVIAKEKISVK